MIVQKDDFLERDGMLYKCVVCDDEIFVLGTVQDVEGHLITHYTHLEAYSNDETINTLADLNFTKINPN